MVNRRQDLERQDWTLGVDRALHRSPLMAFTRVAGKTDDSTLVAKRARPGLRGWREDDRNTMKVSSNRRKRLCLTVCVPRCVHLVVDRDGESCVRVLRANRIIQRVCIDRQKPI
jgi:hypothetical protein